ncbi:MAG: MFS transporter [Clostridium sp.]
MFKKIFYGWYIVLSGFLLMLTVYVLCISCSSLFIKPVSQSLNFSRGEFSFSTTILMISYMIFSVIVGKISKPRNIKGIIIISILLTSLSFLGYFISTNIFMFYIFSFIAGIGVSGSTIIPISILITNWFNKKRGLALALALTGSGVGGAIFSPVINSIIQNHGYRYAYLTLSIILLLLIIPVAIIVKPSPESNNLKPLGYDSSVNLDNSNKEGLSLEESLKNYRLYIFIVSLVIVGIIGNGVLIHFSAALTDLGYSETFAANCLSIGLLLLVIGKIIQGQVFDKFSMKISLIYGWVFFSYTAFGLLFINNPIMLIIYIIAFGLGEGFVVVAPPLMTSSFFGEKDYSSIYGVSNMAVALGGAIGTSLSGIIYDYFGSYNFAWKLYSALSLIMLIIFLVLSPKKQIKIT